MESEHLADLTPNKTLLDPHFDGYKLSLDSLATYSVNLDTGIDVSQLTTNQYSLQHAKAFGVHNHLIVDQWNEDIVFTVNLKWQICRLKGTKKFTPDGIDTVFQIPDAANLRNVQGRVNVTLHFPSPELAILTDGAGHLFLIETGDRKSDSKWKICYKERLCETDSYFTVRHSVSNTDEQGGCIECLLLHVDELQTEAANADKSSFQSVLEWITLRSGDQHTWELNRTRRLVGPSAPDYAALESDGQAVIIGAEAPFKFTFDSLKPIEEPKPEKMDCDDEKDIPTYTWMQTDEDITLQFTLPVPIAKADIVCHISHNALEVGIKNKDNLLRGSLHSKIDSSSSTWTLEGQKLEVSLSKSVEGMWPVLVPEDKKGEHVMDTDQAAKIHERLSHLTSEKLNPSPEDEKPAYNSQELEDCDNLPNADSVLERFDGNSHKSTHKVNLGNNQWLFNCQVNSGKPPCVCYRHDVDGLIWESGVQGTSPWKHVSTFNALGYVQASKRDKKFATCSPNFSYAALSDCVRHVYIYRQPSAILSPLRNRKTGREVGAIAKQQLVTIDSSENIMGFLATNDSIFALAGNKIFIVRVHAEENL